MMHCHRYRFFLIFINCERINYNFAVFSLHTCTQVLSSVEKQHTAAGTVPKIARNGLITMPEMHGKTQVRLIRANIVRLTKIDDAYHLYYYADNSKEYHENDLNFLEVDDSGVEIIKKLIQQYPKYMRVRDLAPQNFDAAQAVAYELWDRGLLMTNVPLK